MKPSLKSTILGIVLPVCFGLTMLPATVLFAQSTAHGGVSEAKKPPVVFPSPNSAVLTRTVNENVDMYTGRLNIEIPIYSLKSRQIEVPISLRIDASGHKVDEIGSWTGLGCNLNAGGFITRVMQSLPDEFTGTICPDFNFPGVGYTKLKANENVDVVRFNPSPVVPAYTPTEYKDIINKGSWNMKENPPAKGYDLMPDQFYFQFGKYSGKFVFDQDGKINLIPQNNLQVTPQYAVMSGNNKITGFTVTTEEGYKYEFGNFSLNAVEETKLKTKAKSIFFSYLSLTGPPAGPQYYFVKNGWPLVDQNQVDFLYTRQPVIMSWQGQPATAPTNGWAYPGDLQDFNHAWNQRDGAEYFYYPSTWHLTKITSPEGDVVDLTYVDNGTIEYLQERSFAASVPNFSQGDYQGFGPLFRAPVSPTPFPSIPIPMYPTHGYFTENESTIFLKSKKLSTITTSQGYSLSFVSTTARQDFPTDKRLDKIQVKHNTTLIKEFLLGYENIYNNDALEQFKFSYLRPIFWWGVDGFGIAVEPATSNFTFPVPDYCRYRMFLKSVQEKGGDGTLVPAYNLEYNTTHQLPFRTSTQQDWYGFANNNVNRHPFNGVSYTATFNGSNETIPKSGDSYPILFFQTTNAGDNGAWPHKAHEGNKASDFARLQAGILKKVTYPTGGTKEFVYEFNGNASAWNGARIKEIHEKETATATDITKFYTYGTYVPVDGMAQKWEMPEFVTETTTSFTTRTKRISFSSQRVNAGGDTKGTAGGYDWVEVSQTGNGRHRVEFYTAAQHVDWSFGGVKIVSSYISPNVYSLGSIGVAYPFPKNVSVDYRRGLPIKEWIYNQDNTKVKYTEYEYEWDPSYAQGQVSYSIHTSKYRVNATFVPWNWMLYGVSSYNGSWVVQKKTTEQTFAPDNTNFLSKISEYGFKKVVHNNKEFVFPDFVKIAGNSKNEHIFQKYRWPLDYAATTDAFGLGIAQLKTKNVLNAPVEQYQYIQNADGSGRRYVGGTLNKYYSDKPLALQSYSLQPSATLTSFTESYINGSSFTHDVNYKSVLNYTSYTPFGGIREQNEESDMKECYIYDLQNTLPVAQVINAAVSDVAYSSFEADGQGGWTYNQANTGQAEKGITGRKYYAVPVSSVNNGFVNSGTLSSTQKYKLTLWVKHGHPFYVVYPTAGASVTTSFSTITPMITINGWRYYEVNIDNAVRVEIGKYSNIGTTYIDEVRLFPRNAQMTTFTFDPLVGMTSQCDANNRIVYYEYDGLQRLKLLKDAFGNVTKTYEYNYKQ